VVETGGDLERTPKQATAKKGGGKPPHSQMTASPESVRATSRWGLADWRALSFKYAGLYRSNTSL
jgi:hypothetical protein